MLGYVKKGINLIMEKVKKLCAAYKHSLLCVIYLVCYLLWFFWLERRVVNDYTVIYMEADDYIPFCELFIIPYFLWFAYIVAVVVFFMFKNKTDYYRTCAFLFTGMTIFLIISTLWPNGHHLRPLVMPRDNIFTHMVASLQSVDTATNLWPSIHVYNSLGAHFAIVCSKEFENRKGIRIASLILASSIVLSTVFLKQHSVFDVLTAFVMAAVMYAVVYRYDIVAILQANRAKRKANPQIG